MEATLEKRLGQVKIKWEEDGQEYALRISEEDYSLLKHHKYGAIKVVKVQSVR